MIRWVPSELHTHTFHSDGRQSLSELAHAAKLLGFGCIALTDHNTMTGLKNKEKIEVEEGIRILSGMEWTTFYGHMVTIGVKDYVDWRLFSSSELHKGISQVHKQGAVVGMAHPFRVGSPICTGCFWEFDIKDYNMIDYVEVWSGTFAPIKNDNQRAFAFWTDLLNHGFHVSATSGRDWHVQESTSDPISSTYLGLPYKNGEMTEAQAVEAIKKGRLSVSIGPLLLLEIEKDGQVYDIGDEIPLNDRQPLNFRVSVNHDVRQGLWEIPEQRLDVQLCSNLGVVSETKILADEGSVYGVIAKSGMTWIRAELYGCVSDVKTLIAFTNPIYLKGN